MTLRACSGCAVLNEDGIPVLLYTGVRLRSSPTCGPLPPEECDLQLPFIESQCSAYPADLGESGVGGGIIWAYSCRGHP